MSHNMNRNISQMMFTEYLKKWVFLMTLIGCSHFVQATELMTWDRLPLAVPLQVGQERVIFVERNVRVGVPSSLNGKLRVQSTGGNVYLLALEPIPPTRIQLQDAENGALILMDIAANAPEASSKPLEPIQIVEGERKSARYGQVNQSTSERSGQTGAFQGAASSRQTLQRETPIPVILTRYAAQNLYAPLRTVEPVAGISRVNLRRDLNLKTLLPMLPVRAQAMAAWRLDDYWVTAVKLRNTSKEVIVLDPRLLQGDFVTASFQHGDLGPAGDATDTTVVYLVTRKRSLAQSLLPAMSQFNAAQHMTVRTQSQVSQASGGQHEK